MIFPLAISITLSDSSLCTILCNFARIETLTSILLSTLSVNTLKVGLPFAVFGFAAFVNFSSRKSTTSLAFWYPEKEDDKSFFFDIFDNSSQPIYQLVYTNKIILFSYLKTLRKHMILMVLALLILKDLHMIF